MGMMLGNTQYDKNDAVYTQFMNKEVLYFLTVILETFDFLVVHTIVNEIIFIVSL